jgi:thiol-disulfide isomerase/thioredoxin
VRRLLAVLLLAAALAGCSSTPDGVRLGYDPVPPSSVQVDTPALREQKAAAGIEDCVPGPGGGELPALELACLGGGTPVDLASLRGPMIVSFWQVGCAPCQEEMPALQRFDDDHGDAVPVLGVDFADQYPASAIEVMQERGITYPSLADPGGDVQTFPEFARIVGMPMLLFVDADGAVAYQKYGGVRSEDELVDLVDEHLGVSL